MVVYAEQSDLFHRFDSRSLHPQMLVALWDTVRGGTVCEDNAFVQDGGGVIACPHGYTAKLPESGVGQKRENIEDEFIGKSSQAV